MELCPLCKKMTAERNHYTKELICYNYHCQRDWVRGVANDVITELQGEKDMGNQAQGIRRFETGATRDAEEGKYDYEGFLSPVVLQAYGKYMHKHRKQSDGKLRDSDNWQGHFGENHYAVCVKSLWRHFMDLWLEHRGFKSRDGLEDALMGIIFNAMAYADKFLKDRIKN